MPPAVVYALASLAVLGPALAPGYLLTLDMIFGPHMPAAEHFYGVRAGTWASLPYLLVLDALTRLLPAWLVQKAILLLTLFFAGWGAHRLTPARGLPAYYAGLFYMVSPFMAVRLLAGQWTLLCFSALLPWALTQFRSTLHHGRVRDVGLTALLWTAAGSFQLHGFALMAMAYGVLAAAHLWSLPRWNERLVVMRNLAFLGGLMLLLNAYWLVPVLMVEGTKRIVGISDASLAIFAPQSASHLGVAFEVLALEGFWRAYGLVQPMSTLWRFAPFVLVFTLFLNGLIAGSVDRRFSRMAITLTVLAILGYVLALGVATSITGPPFRFLWNTVPLFRGFQDSHKFVVFIALAYAVVGSIGVSDLQGGLRRAVSRLQRLMSRGAARWVLAVLMVLPLLIPFAYATRIMGLDALVKPVFYSPEWHEAEAVMANAPDSSNMLVLPWHQYLDISWLDQPQRRLSNPARVFFSQPMIIADNVEFESLYSESTDPVSAYVEFLLSNRERIDNLGGLLALINVRYVLLLKGIEDPGYAFLDDQRDLQLVVSNKQLALYENTHTVARTYSVDRVQTVDALNDLLERSKSEEVLSHVYVLGGHVSSGKASAPQPLEPDRPSLSELQLPNIDKQYVVLSNGQGVPQRGWTYGGRAHVLRNLTLGPVFEALPEPATLRYEPFYARIRWGYLLSLVTLLTLALLLAPTSLQAHLKAVAPPIVRRRLNF